MSENCIHDQYRPRNAGSVDIPTNSKPGFDNFHQDRSRLGEHCEWDPDAPNEWGGKGKTVYVPNDVRLNAMSSMGDLRAKSSNKDPDQDKRDTGSGPYDVPMGYPPYSRNPIFKKRG